MAESANKSKRYRINKQFADKVVHEVINGEKGIEEGLEELNERLESTEPLVEARNRLSSARRALLGGGRLTGGGGSRLRQEDVVEALKAMPGSGPSELLKHPALAGATNESLRSMLSRGKGERFLNKDGKWWLRDPKNGIDTVEDIEDED